MINPIGIGGGKNGSKIIISREGSILFAFEFFSYDTALILPELVWVEFLLHFLAHGSVSCSKKQLSQ